MPYMNMDRVGHATGNSKLKGPIAERYAKFASARSVVEDRAREASRLTIPDLVPERGSTDQTETDIPEQSLGAQGVSTLSGRLTTSLMPPGTSGVVVLEPYTGRAPNDQERAALVQLEGTVHQRLNASGIRAGFHTAMQHLLVAGNACVYIAKDDTLRVYRVDQYVVNRQPDGTVVEVIVHDKVDIQSLPEKVAQQIPQWDKKMKSKSPNERLVDMYSHCLRSKLYNKEYGMAHPLTESKKGDWVVVQEVSGIKITTTPKRFRHLPFIPIRYSNNAGEHWGRSLVYEMRGDLRTYDALSKAIREAAAASSRVVFLANPSGMTDENDVNLAENGDTVPGRVEDVQPLVADLRANLDVAQRYAAELENRLAQQFLMVNGYKRDGERVTAYEKQMDAAELENALGGAYTYISQDFLKPLMNSFIEKLVKDKHLPKEVLDAVEVEVLTGFAALGRQQNLQRLRQFMADVAPIAETVLPMLNIDSLMYRLLKEHGISPEGLVKSQEQAQQEQTTQTAEQALAGAAPDLLTEALAQG